MCCGQGPSAQFPKGGQTTNQGGRQKAGRRGCDQPTKAGGKKPAGGDVTLDYLTDIESVKVGQWIYVTLDFAKLKAEWIESDLGKMDDEDLKSYLACKGQITEIEEDDDSVQLEWCTMESMWIPLKACVTSLPEGVAKDAPGAAFIPAFNGIGTAEEGSLKYYEACDQVKEGDMLFVTPDFKILKTQWKECDLGHMTKEDMMAYTRCRGKVVEIEEDDDTVKLEWITMDSQWIPIRACVRTFDGTEHTAKDAPAAAFVPAFNGIGTAEEGSLKYYEACDQIKEGMTVFVTPDFKILKTQWKECDLGHMTKEDMEAYTRCRGKVVEIEEDDDTVQLEWITMDTQWIPVRACVKTLEGTGFTPKDAPAAAFVPAFNGVGTAEEGSLKYYDSVDQVKEGDTVWVTSDYSMLKSQWKEAELGKIAKKDQMSYCGCSGTIKDIEEDDDTVQLQWANFESQWIPIRACVRSLPKADQKALPA